MRDLIRTKWAAVGAAVAITLGAGGVTLTQAAISSGDKPVYVALVEPCRLVDTRPASNIGPKNTPISAGDAGVYEIQVTGDNGNCTGALAVPADAVAVATNVTAIAPVATATGRSYFTVYPGDAARPTTSNLNFLNGAPPQPNKVDVGLSATGTIKIYNNEGTAHAAVDVFGYYIDHNHDDRYYTKTEIDALIAPLTNSVAAFAGGEQLIDLTGTDEVVRSVSLMPPADGTVIVNSTAHLFRLSGASGGRCSITTGTAVDFDFLQIGNMPDISQAAVVLSGTRGYSVSEGVLFTVNLVCDESLPDVRLQDSALTAIFAPT